MTETEAQYIREQPRFRGIIPFENKIWLSSPTMHGEEMDYIRRAYDSNWMSTVGANIDELEQTAAEFVGMGHAVAVSSGTAALHLAVKLAAERLYGSSSGVCTPQGLGTGGCLYQKRVFCTDATFAATVNPVVYEGGEPIFIDTGDDWNMDPEALENAFLQYPDVRLVIAAHLYGFPAQIGRIKEICEAHHALLIEDAAESLGAAWQGKQTGSFGDYGVLSFNGNKIITGSSGGMLLVNDRYSMEKARKWATQSREAAPWYQHAELGYNYRMSNVIAGIVLGQWKHLAEHIQEKKRIYERYEEKLSNLGIEMNPYDASETEPNFWLPCMKLDDNSVCGNVMSERDYTYKNEHGKTCPMEVIDALAAFHAEARPFWKPMHMQPVYRNHEFIRAVSDEDSRCDPRKRTGRRAYDGFYHSMLAEPDEGARLFSQCVCLPADIKMTEEEQDGVVRIIEACFDGRS